MSIFGAITLTILCILTLYEASRPFKCNYSCDNSTNNILLFKLPMLPIFLELTTKSKNITMQLLYTTNTLLYYTNTLRNNNGTTLR